VGPVTTAETVWSTPRTTSGQWNRCGDGFAYLHETPGTESPNDVEECDDENEDDTDPCTAECRWAICGDGFVYTGGYSDEYDSDEDGNPEEDNPSLVEECDDGNTESGDGCDEVCQDEN
jgi:cysteine-rich repeat protein